jgi:hypothetical protein
LIGRFSALLRGEPLDEGTREAPRS